MDAYGVVDAPKSIAGVRRVPIADMLMKELRAWRLRSKFSRDADIVFPGRRGRPVSETHWLQDRLKPLIEASQVEPLTWHALRHYAVSEWIVAGPPPKTVQTFAGHADIATTMNRYGHHFPEDSHREAMNAIAKGISPP